MSDRRRAQPRMTALPIALTLLLSASTSSLAQTPRAPAPDARELLRRRPLPAATATAIATPAAAAASATPAAATPASALQPAGTGLGPHGGETRCELCHSPDGWSQAAFAHDRTGFPLRGEHARAECKSCHTSARFSDPISPQCVSCHRDPHRSELGTRCEGCHTPQSWASQFSADAHRKTNFPLVGRHALLPCTECHGEVKDRQFTRPTVPCVGCHQQDYDRTASTSVNHAQAGFSTECRQCHRTWTFAQAVFPAHEACFPLARGSHARVQCTGCHPALAGVSPSASCGSVPFTCSSCHAHTCSQMDGEHARVAGYQCKDQKCFECHRTAAGGR